LFLAHLIELLGGVGKLEGHFGLHGDGVNLSEIDACFTLKVPWAWKLFWAYPVKLFGNVAQMEARSVRLEIVLISTHDRCTVCAERTMGTEIFLAELDGPSR
jgi:hypothetical protein